MLPRLAAWFDKGKFRAMAFPLAALVAGLLLATSDLPYLGADARLSRLAAMDQAASDVNAPLLRLEHMLNRPVSFFIMPLFALSNAGVALGSVGEALATPIAIGIILGLVLGKVIGISVFSWLSVRVGWAALPQGANWGTLVATAMLGGIGFTMSLFIAGLAFSDPVMLDEAKIGILTASTVAGVLGYIGLGRMVRGRPAGEGNNT